MKKQLLILSTLFITYNTSAQVGIGTTSPSNDLDVESSSASATAVDINNTSTGDPKINLQVGGTTTFSIGVDNSDSDKLKIGTSALETDTRLTIDASGNVGIGTTTPTALLTVNGNIYMPASSTEGRNLEIGNGRTGNGNSYIDFIGDATYTDYGLRIIRNNNGANADANIVNRGTGILAITAYDAGSIDLKTTNTARLSITSGGLVGIGTASPGYLLTVNGQPAANGYTAFTNYSDSRLKTNVSSLDTGALHKILQLRPVQFQYNDKYLQLYPNSDLNKVHKGFIAQEIQQVFPEMVSEMKESPDSVKYLDLDVSHLQVYLVKALQEQQAIINAQKKEIDAQKAEIDALKQNALKVAELESKMNAMLLLLHKKEEVTAKQ